MCCEFEFVFELKFLKYFLYFFFIELYESDIIDNMNYDLVEKSKEISYALRHRPEEYGLELDSFGFVLVCDLVNAINKKHKSSTYISENDINDIIRQSDKKRFEIKAGRIHAMYGHSCDTTIFHKVGIPPNVLYHGTTREAFDKHIVDEGLKPMNRQYVHLSESIDTAKMVAKRRSNDIVVITIDSAKMVKDGILFYVGNDKVWLCDNVKPKYFL